jgi:hypothetical protein
MVNRWRAWSQSVGVELGLALVFVAGGAASGCKPTIEGRPSLVDGDRVLAVRSEPAEVAKGKVVRYTALYVNPDGPLDPAQLDFALCTQREALAATGAVAPECLAKKAKQLLPLTADENQNVDATIPDDACRVFGPSAPAPKKGEPASRPADPDTTGGYYQPVRVLAEVEGKPDYSVGVTRLDCGLAGATQEQATAYAKQHRPNENPALDTLVVRHGGDESDVSADDADEPTQVKPNEKLSLRARWATCPKTPECGDGICSPGEMEMCMADCPAKDAKGCSGAEPYVALDPVTHKLDNRHEAIRVSWFASDGRFDHERTGRTEAEHTTSFSDNAWVAPSKSGEVRIWVVLRDDRGGVGYRSFKLAVQK